MVFFLAVSQLAVVLLTSALLDIIRGAPPPPSAFDNPTSFPGQLLLGGSGLAVAASVWAASRWFDRRPFRSLGFSLSREWWVEFTFGLGLGALLMTAIFSIERAAGWIQIQPNLDALSAGPAALTILASSAALFIIVGFYEELFNRGYLIKNFSEGFSGPLLDPRWAILASALITSVVFGLLHAFNPNSTLWSTLNIGLAGLFLAVGYLLTGQLAISIGIHISWNFFQGMVFGFPVSGATFSKFTAVQILQMGPDPWTGGAFGPEGGLIGTTAILLGTALIVVWVRARTGQVRLELTLSEYQHPDSASSRIQRAGSTSPIPAAPRFKMPQHIIWDWNGTLLDDLDLCLEAINDILEARQLPKLTQAKYQQVFDFPVKLYYQRLGFDFSKESFESISTQFITAYELGRPQCRLMTGARQALELTSSLKISQSIISASKLDYLVPAVHEYGIDPYFQRIMGLDNHHAAGKLALAKEFLNSEKIDPQHALIIGDTTHDAEIASTLDIPCVLIPNGHHARHRLEKTRALVLDSLQEFSRLLQEISHEKQP